MSENGNLETIPLIYLLTVQLDEQPPGWLYLPQDEEWSMMSPACVLEDVDIGPGDADELSIPDIAKKNKMRRTLELETVKDIMTNAETQAPDITPVELFDAFLYYWSNDAFISLKK